VAWVRSWRSRAGAPPRGSAVPPGRQRRSLRRGKTTSSPRLRRGVAPTARAASRRCWRRPAGRSAGAAAGAAWPRRAGAARRGAQAKRLRPQGRRRRWHRTNGTERARCKPQRRLTSELCPPCPRAQAGGLAPGCWRGVREPWSGGPWPTIGGPSSGPRPCRWRSVSASPRRGEACLRTVAVSRGRRALAHA
jgi:hypothetical protein